MAAEHLKYAQLVQLKNWIAHGKYYEIYTQVIEKLASKLRCVICIKSIHRILRYSIKNDVKGIINILNMGYMLKCFYFVT